MNVNLNKGRDCFESSVTITLCFSGDRVPFDEINSIMQIKATHTRKKSEARIPNEFNRDEWLYGLEKVNCSDVEELFKEFIKIFGQKTDCIQKECQESNCEVYIAVVIHMENCAQPYTILSPDTIAFIRSINAELLVDIWGYDTGEGCGYDKGDSRMNYMKGLR